MYLFSVYSGALKKQFELTQAQLESISTVRLRDKYCCSFSICYGYIHASN